MPSFDGYLLTQRHQITSLETLNSRLSYGENPESLSDLGLVWYRVVTPQTDGRTQTESPMLIRAVARKNLCVVSYKSSDNLP